MAHQLNIMRYYLYHLSVLNFLYAFKTEVVFWCDIRDHIPSDDKKIPSPKNIYKIPGIKIPDPRGKNPKIL